jgi:hypothetical protein
MTKISNMKTTLSTHFKTGQAIPAEDMLAPPTHHLRTSFIPLYLHLALRALLDVLLQVSPQPCIIPRLLLARQPLMPGG